MQDEAATMQQDLQARARKCATQEASLAAAQSSMTVIGMEKDALTADYSRLKAQLTEAQQQASPISHRCLQSVSIRCQTVDRGSVKAVMDFGPPC